MLPPEEVDDTVVCLPKPVCECGGHIKADPEKAKRHQQYELPRIKRVVTEFRQVYDACESCGTTHCGELPHGVSSTLLALRATATVVILTGDYRLGKCPVQRVFKDIFNLSVSLGTISNAEQTVSVACRGSESLCPCIQGFCECRRDRPQTAGRQSVDVAGGNHIGDEILDYIKRMFRL